MRKSLGYQYALLSSQTENAIEIEQSPCSSQPHVHISAFARPVSSSENFRARRPNHLKHVSKLACCSFHSGVFLITCKVKDVNYLDFTSNFSAELYLVTVNTHNAHTYTHIYDIQEEYDMKGLQNRRTICLIRTYWSNLSAGTRICLQGHDLLNQNILVKSVCRDTYAWHPFPEYSKSNA